MEVQPVLMNQRTKVNIDGAANSIKRSEPFPLHALNIPQKIANVLKVEVDALLFQTAPLASPISEEMTMRALSDLLAVRSAQRLFSRGLCARGSDGPEQCH